MKPRTQGWRDAGSNTNWSSGQDTRRSVAAESWPLLLACPTAPNCSVQLRTAWSGVGPIRANSAMLSFERITSWEELRRCDPMRRLSGLSEPCSWRRRYSIAQGKRSLKLRGPVRFFPLLSWFSPSLYSHSHSHSPTLLPPCMKRHSPRASLQNRAASRRLEARVPWDEIPRTSDSGHWSQNPISLTVFDVL